MRTEEAVQLGVQSLALAGGWSASVVTGVQGFAPSTAAASGLPTTDDWRSLLEAFIRDPAALPGRELLKCSEKGEILRGQLAWSGRSLEVICKRFKVRGFWRRRLATWRPSKERVNFDRGAALLRAGIATALPLAVLERKSPRREGWLITEFLAGVVDLDRVALVLLPQLEPDHQRRVKNAITEAIIDLFERLERHNFGHRDLKASNILLTSWDSRDGPVQPWLVDLEGLLTGAASSERRRRQRLVRLAASLLGYASITRTDYCRFLRGYMARTGTGGASWKSQFRELADQTADYVRRARQRKRGKLDGYTGEP